MCWDERKWSHWVSNKGSLPGLVHQGCIWWWIPIVPQVKRREQGHSDTRELGFFFPFYIHKTCLFYFPYSKPERDITLQFNFESYSQIFSTAAAVSLAPASSLTSSVTVTVCLSEPWFLQLWWKVWTITLTLLISWTFTCCLHLKTLWCLASWTGASWGVFSYCYFVSFCLHTSICTKQRCPNQFQRAQN